MCVCFFFSFLVRSCVCIIGIVYRWVDLVWQSSLADVDSVNNHYDGGHLECELLQYGNDYAQPMVIYHCFAVYFEVSRSLHTQTYEMLVHRHNNINIFNVYVLNSLYICKLYIYLKIDLFMFSLFAYLLYVLFYLIWDFVSCRIPPIMKLDYRKGRTCSHLGYKLINFTNEFNSFCQSN